MIWYPYEQMKTMTPPYEIVDAEGVYLYTKERRLIDSISSWWSVIHGYKHPVLTEAIRSQAERFSHVMLGGLTHEPVQKLSAKLEEWLPGDLDCCFFSDSGSVAVEVALKIALQYFINRGEKKRTKILALEHAYHGDTFKAMEAGDDEDYHFILKACAPLRQVMHIPARTEALASIRLFEEEDYMSRIRRIEAVTRRELKGFSDPRIREIRIMGACVCMEVNDSAALKGYQRFAFERGVFSRPFLNYLYAMVPYIITEEELVQVLDTMKAWFA